MPLDEEAVDMDYGDMAVDVVDGVQEEASGDMEISFHLDSGHKTSSRVNSATKPEEGGLRKRDGNPSPYPALVSTLVPSCDWLLGGRGGGREKGQAGRGSLQPVPAFHLFVSLVLGDDGWIGQGSERPAAHFPL